MASLNNFPFVLTKQTQLISGVQVQPIAPPIKFFNA